MYYDKEGNEISHLSWCQLFGDQEYRLVKRTEIGSDGGFVSTVWLGLNHSWDPEGDPLIFETMVFDLEDHPDNENQWRYSTEEEAVAHHDEIVELLRGQTQ